MSVSFLCAYRALIIFNSKPSLFGSELQGGRGGDMEKY